VTKTTKKPIKSDDNYLLPKQLKEEESIEARTKEIEMIKVIGKNKGKRKAAQMN
jgi:hypothetical protein